MSSNDQVAEALAKLFEDLVNLIPKSKHPQARSLVESFEKSCPISRHKVDGRSTAWGEQRRAEAAARWAQKRADEVFYFYKYDPRRKEVVETVITGVEECCAKLRIREAYLRSRLSSGRGYCTFGTGLNKMTISKKRFSSDPEERFRQEFIVRHNREPGHHEYPGSGGY